MSQCNYCSWQQLKKRGCRIATAKDRKEWNDNTSVEFESAFGAGTVIVNKEGKRVSWMMELPDHCCC